MAGFSLLDQKEPGCWSLARGPNSISFIGDEVVDSRGVLIALYNAVPVPNKDVPLVDILEFKAKRRDELWAFRVHLENVYQKILSQPDFQLSASSEQAQLEKSLADYIKTAKKSRWPFRIASEFSAKINLSPSTIGAAFALGVGVNALSGPVAAIAASLIPLIEVKGEIGLKGRKRTSTPFEYVASYHRDLFIRSS